MTAPVLWWHMFGGPAPLGEDDGKPCNVWMQVTLGECSKPPGEWLGAPYPVKGALLPHLGSWDHEPTQAEQNAVVPPAWRD